MKLLKKEMITLSIFVFFILLGTISFAMYQTVEEITEKQKQEITIKQEATLSKEEQETLDLINEYRKENGLVELKATTKLQEVAKLKAKDLVDNNYFSHTSPNLGTPFEMLQDQKVDYKIAGENLAGNTTSKKAVEAWMNSKTHKENILEEKFEYTGIYVIDSPIYGKVFVQIFIGIE